MSDWRFASVSGFLVWTSPTLPDGGGTELFSELSPTLIIGLQEQGDVLPIDYIKISTITSVSLVGQDQRGIELQRDGAPAVLLVAPSQEAAGDWLRGIQAAVGETADTAVKPRYTAASSDSVAAVVAAPLNREPSPMPTVGLATSMRLNFTAAADASQPSSMVDHPIPAGSLSLSEANRSRGGSAASAAAASSSVAANAQAIGSAPVLQTSRAASETGSLRLQAGGSTTSVPRGPPTPASHVGSVTSFGGRGMSAISGNGQPFQPVATHASTPGATSAGNGLCETDSAHVFRPLSEITGVAPASAVRPLSGGTRVSGSGPATTTITTHVDAVRARPHQLPAPLPFSNGYGSTPVTSAQLAVGSKAAASGLTNITVPSPSPSMTVNRPLPTRGGSLSLGHAASMSPIVADEGAVHAAGVGSFAPTNRGYPAAGSTAAMLDMSQSPMFRGDSNLADPLRFSGVPADATPAYPTAAAPAFEAANLRKRSGMLIDVPANPQVNRNTAPNVSAIWKQWSGPDGVQYVCHEATGTVQRKNPETGEFETLIDGTRDIDPEDIALRPYNEGETTLDVNHNVVRNLNHYGGSPRAGAVPSEVLSPSVYRTEPVSSPRGQYSPTRKSHLAPLAAPRQSQSTYNGRRVHHLTLGIDDGVSPEPQIEHRVEVLGGNVRWDPRSGNVVTPPSQGEVGASTLQRQWEHVRRILMQGRYFKKHALRTTSTSFRFAFLTSDNAYVVCVPTSDVLFHVNEAPKTFSTMAETIQYYGPDSRAIALNTITHVSLGIDEPFVRNRANQLVPANTFCIVSRTHAFILECNTSEEAKYFADAWTFFLYHSKPVNTKQQKTPQMKNPVTFGTRTGIAF